jgi:chitodextrinase
MSWTAATDAGGSGLKGYNVLRNNTKIATLSQTTFDDGTVQPGTSYSYTVIAFDGAGNVSPASNVVTVKTPTPTPAADVTAPTAGITSPTANTTISGSSSVTANVKDETGLSRASLLVDGTTRATVLNPASGSVTFTWQTTLVSDGEHTLSVTTVDTSGNVGTSSPVTVVIKNNTVATTTDRIRRFFPADAALYSKYPNTNYGSKTSMSVDGSPKEKMIMKFTVTGIRGKVKNAIVRMYITNGSSVGGTLYSVTNNSWDESKITWNNAPYFYDRPAVASWGKVVPGKWVNVPVTAVVKGDGAYTFGGRSEYHDGADYATHEDSTPSHRPRLVITEEL